MEIIKKGWEWLVKSSVNADQWALTVKGFLSGIVPVLLIVLNLTHVKFNDSQVTDIVDFVVQIVAGVGTLVSTAVMVFGLLRKIGTTLTGTNEVVAGWSDRGY